MWHEIATMKPTYIKTRPVTWGLSTLLILLALCSLLSALCLLPGCTANIPIAPTDPYAMTPAERLAAAERIWSAQSKDCEFALTRSLTSKEAQFYAKKARYLEDTGKAIDIYRVWVKGGSPPAGMSYADMEARIIQFITTMQTGGTPW